MLVLPQLEHTLPVNPSALGEGRGGGFSNVSLINGSVGSTAEAK
jgi:hypothetical protein